MPTNYSFNSQTIKGRDITDLPYVKKWLALQGYVIAIGKFTECNGNNIMIMGLRDGNTTHFRFVKIGPKGEYLGWKPISSLTLYGGKSRYLMNINLSKNGNELIVIESNTYFETGNTLNDERKANCAEEWKI